MESLTIAMLVVAGLLVMFRLSVSTKGAKKARRRGMFQGGPGAGGAGAFYEMLNEDKRKAIEIIVEEKAGARDEETADDTVLPASPRGAIKSGRGRVGDD
ncbi:MAG: hypothetical protein M3R55_08715 [Acidobacteriota bacterium]|nr:hypothetical protein [Acidobacteriota bacterium]